MANSNSNPGLYASAFSESRSPPATFHPTSLRLSLHRALSHDVSTYLHERAQIEEHYVKSLEKLSTRLHSDGGGGGGGVFAQLDQFRLEPRQLELSLGTSLLEIKTLLSREVDRLAQVHQEWSKKVVDQIEKPMRDTPTSSTSEWSRWNLEDKNLKNQVNEYESLVDKLSKAQKSSTKSNKLLSTQSSLSSLGSSLTASLPSYLTLSQQVESTHVQLFQQLLTQYGTFSTDLARERMELGERLVEKVLSFDPAFESQEWALRQGAKANAAGRVPDMTLDSPSTTTTTTTNLNEFGQQQPPPPGSREREQSYRDDTESLTPSASTRRGGGGDQLDTNDYQRERTSSRLSTAPPVAPLPLPTSVNDDARSITSNSQSISATTTTPSKSKSRFGSKISSFLKKDKDKSSSNEKKEKRDRSSSIPNSARYSSFTDDQTRTPPLPLAPPPPAASSSLEPPRMERNRSSSSDLLGGPSGGEGNGSYQTPLQPTPVNNNNNKTKRESSFLSPGGGGLFRRQSKMGSISDEQGPTTTATTTTTIANGYGNGEPFVAEPSSISSPAGGGGGVDSEGFSVPPKGYDRAIGESSLSRGQSNNLMDDDDDDDEQDDRRPLGGESVPKLSILPVASPSSTSIPAPGSPILSQESEQERLAALSAIKNSLGAPPSSSASVAGGLNRRATARGRRSEAANPAATLNRHSMLPSATTPSMAGLSAAAGAGAGAGFGLAGAAASSGGGGGAPGSGLDRRETDDDVPLATIQQESRRRAAPPPPTSGGGGGSGLSSPPPLSPSFPPSTTNNSSAASNSNNVVPIASSINNPSRTMSILSTNSSIATAGTGGGGTSTLARRDPFEGSTEPGTRISIVEQINVLMRGGEVQKVLVTGEIGISYRPEPNSNSTTTTKKKQDSVLLRLDNFDQVEKTAPNSTYLSTSGGGGGGGEYKLSLSSLSTSLASSRGQTVPLLKYQLKPNSSIRDFVPLIVKPTWRCEPNLTRIIVVYSRNPSFSPTTTTTSPFGDDDDTFTPPGGGGEGIAPVEFRDVELEIPFGVGQVSSFQSKPGSIGSKRENGSLSFSLAPSLEGEAETKLLVSAQTEGSTAKVGNMSLKWRIQGQTVGKIGVELVGIGEEGDEEEEIKEVRREIESGKYIIA